MKMIFWFLILVFYSGCVRKNEEKNSKVPSIILEKGNRGVKIKSISTIMKNKDFIEICFSISNIYYLPNINAKDWSEPRFIRKSWDSEKHMIFNGSAPLLWPKVGSNQTETIYCLLEKNLSKINFEYNEIQFEVEIIRGKSSEILDIRSLIFTKESKNGLVISELNARKKRDHAIYTNVNLKYIKNKNHLKNWVNIYDDLILKIIYFDKNNNEIHPEQVAESVSGVSIESIRNDAVLGFVGQLKNDGFLNSKFYTRFPSGTNKIYCEVFDNKFEIDLGNINFSK